MNKIIFKKAKGTEFLKKYFDTNYSKKLGIVNDVVKLINNSIIVKVDSSGNIKQICNLPFDEREFLKRVSELKGCLQDVISTNSKEQLISRIIKDKERFGYPLYTTEELYKYFESFKTDDKALGVVTYTLYDMLPQQCGNLFYVRRIYSMYGDALVHSDESTSYSRISAITDKNKKQIGHMIMIFRSGPLIFVHEILHRIKSIGSIQFTTHMPKKQECGGTIESDFILEMLMYVLTNEDYVNISTHFNPWIVHPADVYRFSEFLVKNVYYKTFKTSETCPDATAELKKTLYEGFIKFKKILKNRPGRQPYITLYELCAIFAGRYFDADLESKVRGYLIKYGFEKECKFLKFKNKKAEVL